MNTLPTAIAAEIDANAHLPCKGKDYHPLRLEIYCDDVLAVVRESGRTTHELQLPAQYHPELIMIYCDDELILAVANDKVLLNRLPEIQTEQQTYVI
jgi:hypothetical protein